MITMGAFKKRTNMREYSSKADRKLISFKKPHKPQKSTSSH